MNNWSYEPENCGRCGQSQRVKRHTSDKDCIDSLKVAVQVLQEGEDRVADERNRYYAEWKSAERRIERLEAQINSLGARPQE